MDLDSTEPLRSVQNVQQNTSRQFLFQDYFPSNSPVSGRNPRNTQSPLQNAFSPNENGWSNRGQAQFQVSIVLAP